MPPNPHPFDFPFPSTRYQGSKRKLAGWIAQHVNALDFTSVLDVFGGTGVLSHRFKNAGKRVTYNDLLSFNHNIGLALIENRNQTLSGDDVAAILRVHDDIDYPNLIQQHFQDIYFTDEENAWLDRVITNIEQVLSNRYKRALARFALFQACLIKRPYNLFHRANLYMRTAQVQRSFGNKTTWDTPFETHFRQFIAEANRAVFDNGQQNTAICRDALETPTGFDLVYMDPPYLNSKGVGVDYRDFYHFLEGVMDYDNWADQIDTDSKHCRLQRQVSPWNDAATITAEFARLFDRHRDSILVLSYRDDGIPSKAQLKRLLLEYKETVYEAVQPMQYVLSNKPSHELLLVAV